MKKKTKERQNDWEVLVRLVLEYGHARVQDSWKGSAHPEDKHVIALEFELAREKVFSHIRKMQIEYEG